jgi:cytochrome d ubiquinol oxidase subunit II
VTDLAIIWAGILAFAVFAYVVLDGFDLGIGMLAPFSRSDEEEETMITAIAPVWDGNETWLVLGGGGLLAAFPLAYSVLMPALYAPIIAMLLALIFRGVAFEFRHRNADHLRWWTWGFILGSYVATFAQGIALGT